MATTYAARQLGFQVVCGSGQNWPAHPWHGKPTIMKRLPRLAHLVPLAFATGILGGCKPVWESKSAAADRAREAEFAAWAQAHNAFHWTNSPGVRWNAWTMDKEATAKSAGRLANKTMVEDVWRESDQMLLKAHCLENGLTLVLRVPDASLLGSGTNRSIDLLQAWVVYSVDQITPPVVRNDEGFSEAQQFAKGTLHAIKPGH